MSTVETPEPVQATAPRQCPRCGAPMTDDQEWCLRCGAAVGTSVVAAPGWRAPIVITGVIVILAAIAVAVAIIQLADDTGQVAEQPAVTVTPTPSAIPSVVPSATPDPSIPPVTSTVEPAPTVAPTTTPDPVPTTTPEPTTSGDIAEWPVGTNGWTVVLASDTSESSARSKAEDFAAQGIADVGILNSDDFGSLEPGYWVVYSGEFDDQAAAADALDGIEARDAYIRRIASN